MATILVVDADEHDSRSLRDRLEPEGHEVVRIGTAAHALDAVRRRKPDLIVIDPALPDASGFEACRMLRGETVVPMIIVTASGEELDKVVGLELGADDYVTKPAAPKELLARISAHLRRSRRHAEPARELVVGDLKVDVGQRRVTRAGSELSLRPREFELLAFLVQNRGRTFTREELLSRIWGYSGFGKTRTVDVHIDRLRDKVEDIPQEPRRILTVRGSGYRFEG
jgi:DNA-binding response OmpR family regulator